MSNFGKALHAIRIKRGLSQEGLAKLLGTSKQVISRYENGQRTPKISVAVEYANVLGVSLSELNGDIDFRPDILPVSKRRIPMLGTIAAGEPIYADEEHDMYFAEGCDPACDFALKVSGDSMEPRFSDGDIVFFRAQDDVTDGQIAAVIVDDSATLKRVYHLKNGVQLVSDNHKYTPMIYDESNCSTIRILGLAIGFYRSLS